MNSISFFLKMNMKKIQYNYMKTNFLRINMKSFSQTKVAKEQPKITNENKKPQETNKNVSKDNKDSKNSKEPITEQKPFIYVPLESRTPEISKEIFDNYTKEFLNEYGGRSLSKSKYYSDVFEHFSKKRRRVYLNSFYWPYQALKIKVERMREYDDCQFTLNQKNLVPIRIAAREEFPQLDFVVKRKYFTRWMK